MRRALRRLACLLLGHRLTTYGPLLIEGHYIERVSCTRCHEGAEG